MTVTLNKALWKLTLLGFAVVSAAGCTKTFMI
jgi:hypothetical protein